MIKSFNSWDDINEAKVRGKQILRSPSGKRQKIAFKIQDDNKFLIKIIHMNDIIANGKMTQEGAAAITNFINSQLALVNSFGKIDSKFFSTKFIIYTVKKDSRRQEKVQFTIAVDADHPEIPTTTQYISSEEAEALLVAYNAKNTDATDTGLKDVVKDNEETAVTDDTEENPELVDDEGGVEDAEGSDEIEEELWENGYKFMYTMKTNMKTYICKFVDGGAIDAHVKGEKAPNGAVSWEDPKIMWFTDLDNEDAGKEYADWVDRGAPLYIDQEITHKMDVDFFTKMFTDEEFRDDILKKYNDEYGDSEVSLENIRNMLYFKDNSRIFPSATTTTTKKETETKDSGADPSDVDQYDVKMADTKYF